MTGGKRATLRALYAMFAGAALVAVPAIAAAPAQIHVVTIQQMAFGRLPASVHVGDRIQWVNNDLFVHTATAADKSFDVVLKPKSRATTVVRKAGRTAFFCRFHPAMKGILTVAR